MKRWGGVLLAVMVIAPHPQSRLCIRCRDAGVIVEADLATLDSCREHMAEDRINDLIKRSGAW